MTAFAFLLLATLSPEEKLTVRLRSAETLTVQVGKNIVSLKTPRQALRRLRVLRIQRGAVDGEPVARLWFGGDDPEPYAVWPADAPWDMTHERQAVDLAPEFWTELNRELTKELGRKVDVRRAVP
jgi:hypothetical protein